MQHPFNEPADAAIRREQLSVARRIQAGDRPERPIGAAGKKFVAKGHDRQLEEAQFGQLRVTVVPMGDPDTPYRGRIVKRDKFTITILDDGGTESMIYKHAIEAVQIDRSTADKAH